MTLRLRDQFGDPGQDLIGIGPGDFAEQNALRVKHNVRTLLAKTQAPAMGHTDARLPSALIDLPLQVIFDFHAVAIRAGTALALSIIHADENMADVRCWGFFHDGHVRIVEA